MICRNCNKPLRDPVLLRPIACQCPPVDELRFKAVRQ